MTNLKGQALKKFIKKAILVWTGICSIVFGILGTILPIIPGFVFILAGLIMLSKGSSTIRNVFIMQILINKTKQHLEKSDNHAFRKLLTFL